MHKFTTLVATDFSKSSFIVLSKALEFTQKTGGVMHVVHVAEHSVFSFKKNLDSIRAKSFNKLKEAFPSIGEDYFHCVAGKVKNGSCQCRKRGSSRSDYLRAKRRDLFFRRTYFRFPYKRYRAPLRNPRFSH